MARQSIKMSVKTIRAPHMPKLAIRRSANGKRKA